MTKIREKEKIASLTARQRLNDNNDSRRQSDPLSTAFGGWVTTANGNNIHLKSGPLLSEGLGALYLREYRPCGVQRRDSYFGPMEGLQNDR